MTALLKSILKAMLRIEHKVDILVRAQRIQNPPRMNHNLTDPVTGRSITWDKVPTGDGRPAIIRNNDGYNPPN